MHLGRQGVVGVAGFDHAGHRVFERFGFVAQGQYLPLGQGNRAAAVRVRDKNLRDQVGVILKEFGIVLEVLRDGVGIHGGGW